MAILGVLLVGIILASTVVSAFLMTRVDESRGELQTFTSRGELEDFIARSIEEAESSGIFPGLARDVMTITVLLCRRQMRALGTQLQTFKSQV